MKKIFNCNEKTLFESLENLLLHNAEEFGNIKINDISKLKYSYNDINVKIVDIIKYNKISYVTSNKANETFKITFSLFPKNNKTVLVYKIDYKNTKLNSINYFLLSNTIYFFKQRRNFNLMCEYLKENI